jgi:two-component system, OmpR family, response regulator
MAARKPVHILIVDDEIEVRTVLREFFELEGYRVHEAKDGAEMHQHLEHHPVNLITLDIKIAGEDGIALARDIRAKRNVPIIMISGRQDVTDRIVALELGADDFIAKPFQLREVLARVRAVLRRYRPEQEMPAAALAGRSSMGRYRFNGFELFPQRRELIDENRRVIELTTAEFNLLEMFACHPARVMTRDSIMDLLKGHDWSPFDRSIDTLVGRLRRKIEKDTEHPKFIKTVRGVGYVFTADVEKVQSAVS